MDKFTKLLIESWQKKIKEFEKTDREAKKQGQLVGRYIKESIADGYAYYKIVKEGKKSVEIRHIKGIGDDYMISYWGKQATINKDYAKKSIEFRDKLSEIFS